MKQLASLVFVLLFAVSGATAKDRVSPHTTVKGHNMSITYGQPSKKGRDVFGGLEAYGKVWRTGADEATEITISKDCLFAGKQLKAGTYTLFTIPGKDEFTVILNAKLGQWGAFEYDKVKDQDVLTSNLPVTHLSNVVEKMTFTIEKAGVKLEWDKTSVLIPVKFFDEQ